MFRLYQQLVRARPVELGSAFTLCYFLHHGTGELSLAKDSAVAVVTKSRAQSFTRSGVSILIDTLVAVFCYNLRMKISYCIVLLLIG